MSRPDLRRVRRRDVVVYRIRAGIDDATPPIWRRLDVRSDLTLDLLHQVLQVTFDWTDSHLHRFSLGGGTFDGDSQLFLCPYDVDNEEWEEYDGLPAGSGDPAALVVDGERAAPPEDRGHTPRWCRTRRCSSPSDSTRDLVTRTSFCAKQASTVRLVDMVHQLTYTPYGDDLTTTALALAGPEPVDTIDWTAHLRAHQRFLDRAEDGGIPLTAAGYLKAADVESASKAVPAMQDWSVR